MAYDVFISHSAKDKAIVDAVCAGLEVAKIRCWVAPRDILPGENFAEAILDAIAKCKIMIVIFSSNSNNSEHVKREVACAFNKNVIVIPFRIEKIDPTGEMEYYLVNTHWLDALTAPIENQINKLIDTIRPILNNPRNVKMAANDESTNASLEENKLAADDMLDRIEKNRKWQRLPSTEANGPSAIQNRVRSKSRFSKKGIWLSIGIASAAALTLILIFQSGTLTAFNTGPSASPLLSMAAASVSETPTVPSSGFLSKIGLGNLSADEVAAMDHLYVIGTRKFDQYYYARYNDDMESEVRIIDLNTAVPIGDLSDISDIALLKNAKIISIEGDHVSDISPLFNIKPLRDLTLNCNPVKSLEGIETLQNLMSIKLDDTDVSDLSPLFKIPTLRNISFDNTKVSSIEGIENLRNLMCLSPGDSDLTDISPLNKIDFSFINGTNGFVFQAMQSHINDFSPLQRVPKFDEIRVSSVQPDRILPYISNKQVNRLYFMSTDLQNVSQLSSIENIQVLYLTDSSRLTSIAGIENHADLTEINLCQCPKIADLSPLLKLKNLKNLYISPDKKTTVQNQLKGATFQITYQDK